MDGTATVAYLRRRTQHFIAYLYKPEVQAKVFQRIKAFSPRRRKDREEAEKAEEKAFLPRINTELHGKEVKKAEE